MTTAEAVNQVSFVQATNQALFDALAEDDRVLVFGEDVADEQGGGVIKVTAGLSTKYGSNRVRTTPISEQAIIGAATGAAIAGYRPVAEIMLMNFVSVCMDQLFNHAAKLRYMSGGKTPVPITVRTTTGPGLSFGAQHSDMLEAWLAHSAGLKVVMPSTPADAYGLLLSCIFDDDPCVFVEHSLMYFAGVKGSAPETGERVPLGSAATRREGSDVSVIGYGKAIVDALAVATTLAEEGIDIEVVDLRTVQPFDREAILQSVAKTKRAVIVHEAVREFGVGAELAATITEELFSELERPVARVGGRYAPIPYSPPLEAAWAPGVARIERAVREQLR